LAKRRAKYIHIHLIIDVKGELGTALIQYRPFLSYELKLLFVVILVIHAFV